MMEIVILIVVCMLTTASIACSMLMLRKPYARPIDITNLIAAMSKAEERLDERFVAFTTALADELVQSRADISRQLEEAVAQITQSVDVRSPSGQFRELNDRIELLRTTSANTLDGAVKRLEQRLDFLGMENQRLLEDLRASVRELQSTSASYAPAALGRVELEAESTPAEALEEVVPRAMERKTKRPERAPREREQDFFSLPGFE